MKQNSTAPRLAREGFVPAGPERRVNKRKMLIQKTGDPYQFLPRIMDYSEWLHPGERRALREIVETAEVVRENGRVYLVARVSAATLDSLASFEAERAEREPGGDDEPDADDEPDFDNEPENYVLPVLTLAEE